jgi:hypothetical protein
VAEAFCGFYVAGADGALYNNATQVVMMRSGTTTVLSMQNNYKGPPENFAMVVPVPEILQEDNVKTLPRDVFERVDRLAAPRLVEYWEQDPCAPQIDYEMALPASAPMRTGRGKGAKKKEDLGVTVEAKFTVGEYEIVILSAKFSTGLEKWLLQEKYKIPQGAEKYLRPYVETGSKFFVAKVNAKKVKFEDGRAMLSPLRFHYESKSFNLPVRLGLMNSEGHQDLLVHILSQGSRYEVANYPNVTIPTNLNLNEEVRGRFGEFYAALFDSTLEKNPKAVVTEYSWSAASCDPCPTPPLSWPDLMTLGYDVSGGNSASSPPPFGGRGRRVMGSPGGFILTRLHARYSKEDLGEDLVFREAPAIAGGREFLGANGKLEEGSVSSHVNNFQGRYAIRHEWEGEVSCENPRRGIWGGPPAGHQQAATEVAKDLAFAARGQIQLSSMVPAGIPELGLKGQGDSIYGNTRGGNTTTGPKLPGEKPPKIEVTEDSRKKKSSKEGCAAGGGNSQLWLSVLLLGLFFRRRGVGRGSSRAS